MTRQTPPPWLRVNHLSMVWVRPQPQQMFYKIELCCLFFRESNISITCMCQISLTYVLMWLLHKGKWFLKTEGDHGAHTWLCVFQVMKRHPLPHRSAAALPRCAKLSCTTIITSSKMTLFSHLWHRCRGMPSANQKKASLVMSSCKSMWQLGPKSCLCEEGEAGRTGVGSRNWVLECWSVITMLITEF